MIVNNPIEPSKAVAAFFTADFISRSPRKLWWHCKEGGGSCLVYEDGGVVTGSSVVHGLPGVARRQVTFLASPRKVTQRRRSPIRHLFEVPCVARLVRRLRNSRYALRQSSPKSPDQPPLLGGGRGERKSKPKTHSVGTSCPPCNYYSSYPE